MPQQRTKVDRLAVSVSDNLFGIKGFFADTFGHLGPIDYEQRAGSHGFEGSSLITAKGALVGWWGYGGTSQRGRSYVDITGLGCNLVQDWNVALEGLKALPGVKAKRIDIAADFYRGEVSYEDTLAAYQAGRFSRGGRPPKMQQILPGSFEEGRTIYVGSRGNDVFFRGYEKGKKEFGELPAQFRAAGLSCVTTEDDDGQACTFEHWFRAELELRAAKRPLPFDVVSMRDQYFAGAYPFLEEILPNVDPLVLVTPEHIAAADLDKALANIKRQYGSTLFTALAAFGGDYLEVWERIVGREHNEKLLKSGVGLLVQ